MMMMILGYPWVRGQQQPLHTMLLTVRDLLPPKKKAKIVRKTYRLLALVSTSPEELFNRKILLEEYGEAILLAGHYGLDTDSVYRRQWQQSSKSAAAIQDYL